MCRKQIIISKTIIKTKSKITKSILKIQSDELSISLNLSAFITCLAGKESVKKNEDSLFENVNKNRIFL